MSDAVDSILIFQLLSGKLEFVLSLLSFVFVLGILLLLLDEDMTGKMALNFCLLNSVVMGVVSGDGTDVGRIDGGLGQMHRNLSQSEHSNFSN